MHWGNADRSPALTFIYITSISMEMLFSKLIKTQQMVKTKLIAFKVIISCLGLHYEPQTWRENPCVVEMPFRMFTNKAFNFPLRKTILFFFLSARKKLFSPIICEYYDMDTCSKAFCFNPSPQWERNFRSVYGIGAEPWIMGNLDIYWFVAINLI